MVLPWIYLLSSIQQNESICCSWAKGIWWGSAKAMPRPPLSKGADAGVRFRGIDIRGEFGRAHSSLDFSIVKPRISVQEPIRSSMSQPVRDPIKKHGCEKDPCLACFHRNNVNVEASSVGGRVVVLDTKMVHGWSLKGCNASVGTGEDRNMDRLHIEWETVTYILLFPRTTSWKLVSM